MKSIILMLTGLLLILLAVVASYDAETNWMFIPIFIIGVLEFGWGIALVDDDIINSGIDDDTEEKENDNEQV